MGNGLAPPKVWARTWTGSSLRRVFAMLPHVVGPVLWAQASTCRTPPTAECCGPGVGARRVLRLDGRCRGSRVGAQVVDGLGEWHPSPSDGNMGRMVV